MANEKEGSGIPSWAVAAVAILGIVGFMWWISSAAQPRDMVAITEGDDTAAATSGGMTGEVVGLDQIATDASGLVGRDIILEDVTVAAGMGQQAFWIDLPNQQPFLIRMGGAVVPVQSGDVVDVAGRMQTMNDSVVAAWTSSGAITQGQEAEARFAQTFLEAATIRAAQ